MNDTKLNFTTSPTALSVGLFIGALFLGTGGFSVAKTITPERNGFSFAMVTNNQLIIDDDKTDDTSGSALEFQKLSLQLMNTYGFSVKQYSEIMRVTRATIYKWHDLNIPLKKVQSKNLNRLNRLNKSLFGVKDKRKELFSAWLRNPLDEDAQLISSLLKADKISLDCIIEQTQKINVGLHSYETSNELDELLGLS